MQRSPPASAFLTWDMDSARKPFQAILPPLPASVEIDTHINDEDENNYRDNNFINNNNCIFNGTF